MAHHCHAIKCEVEVPPAMLTCKPHWFRVPLALRNRVWAEYEKGGREPELLLYDMVQTED